MEKLNEQYYKLISKEISSQFEMVSSLVDNARLASGEWKEQIFRNILIKYLPSRFGVGRGYIKNALTGMSSKQIDILIYDKAIYPPYFQDRDFVIIPAESAIAIIEIKSGTITKKEEKYNDFKIALENIKIAKQVVNKKSGTSNMIFPASFIIFINSIWSDFNEFGHCLSDWPEKIENIYYPQAIISWGKYLGWTFHQPPCFISIGKIKENDDISFNFFFGILIEHLLGYQGIKPKPDWATFYRKNFFDMEHPDRKIWETKGIKIGDGIVEIPKNN